MNNTKEVKAKMAAAVEHLKTELKTIRTGRAHPALLDKVVVEVYGSPMRIKDLANVTAPEARQLLITPFDRNNVGAIAKGIDAANLGVRAVADGSSVRATVPQPDEATRKEMVKVCKHKCEDAKVAIRNVRREGNESVRQAKSAGIIPEDLMKKLEKEIQTLTDQFCKEADEATKAKEAEVMAV